MYMQIVSATYLHTFLVQMLTRVLYIWALHHPASGYVQGINDLLTPFIAVFLSEYVREYSQADMWPISCEYLLHALLRRWWLRAAIFL